MRSRRCALLPRTAPVLPALALLAALTGSTSSPLPAAASGLESPEAAFDAERGLLHAELAAIRAGLLHAVGSCREQTAATPPVRAACDRAEVRLRQAAVLEQELGPRSEPSIAADRAAAGAQLERWREALGGLRRELASLERRLAASGALTAAHGRSGAGPLGAIAGLVTAAPTGDPIPDAFVDIYDDTGTLVTSALTDAGGSYITQAVLPAGTYFAITFAGPVYIDELYDDIDCPSFSCDPTTGTGIPVTAGGTTSGIDFALDFGGLIAGTVTEDGTGTPIAGVVVLIWNDQGGFTTTGTTDATGLYTSLVGLPTGIYFATTSNESSYLNELYDDLPCPFSFSCIPTTGTAIAVTENSTTSGIDFALTPGGAIAGSVTEDGTGSPLGAFVAIFKSSGAFVTFGSTDSAGAYFSDDGLPTDTYFARTDVFSLHVNELYDDIACPFFCASTTGTPIAVTVGTTTAGIDFALAAGGGIQGRVITEATGDPISGTEVGLYDGAGDLLTSLFCNVTGIYSSFSGVPVGTYYARTLNGHLIGLANERYDELPCLQTCPVTEGTPIAVVAGTSTVGVDFSLAVQPLFFDSFESGGLGFWSAVAGGVGCAHSMCTTGGPLSAGCDPCAATICGVDPSCCDTAWDILCVIEVRTVCGLECP